MPNVPVNAAGCSGVDAPAKQSDAYEKAPGLYLGELLEQEIEASLQKKGEEDTRQLA